MIAEQWEDDGAGKVVRIVFGPAGHVQLADAAYLNKLESLIDYLIEAMDSGQDHASRDSLDSWLNDMRSVRG